MTKRQKHDWADYWIEEPWVLIHAAYNKRFVDALKSVIDPDERSYHDDLKIWRVRSTRLLEVIALLNSNFSIVRCLKQDSKISPYHAMLEGLPNDVIKKVYRVIVSSVHPDHGHDSKILTQVNVAWEAVKKQRAM